MVDAPNGVTAALQAEAGDALRVVATYDTDGYETVYCRDDVAGRMAEHAPDIHDDLVLQGVGREHLESLFEAGRLHCSVHRFEDLTAFHFLADEYTGLFVSVDADADIRLASFADTCRGYLEPSE
jgi:hypothetical protein